MEVIIELNKINCVIRFWRIIIVGREVSPYMFCEYF